MSDKIYSNNNGLTNFQKVQKYLYSTPKKSLTNWSVEKIDYLDKKKKIEINTAVARIAKRLLVIAMPFFALADAFRFVGETIFKAVTLKPGEALYDLLRYDLLRCAKSFELFIASIPAMLVGLISPVSVYRTEEAWKGIMHSQVNHAINKMREKKADLPSSVEEKQENLSLAFQEILENMIQDPDTRKKIMPLIEERNEDDALIGGIISEIPWNDDREDLIIEDLIIEEYTNLFAMLLVVSATHQIQLDKINEDKHPFILLAKEIIKIRKPELRIKLLNNLLISFKDNDGLLNKWEINIDHNTNNYQYITVFQVLQLLDHTENIDNDVISMLGERGFKDKTCNIKLISVLADLIDDPELSPEMKTQVLQRLGDCYQEDKRINDIVVQRHNLEEKLNRARKPKGKAGRMHKALEKSKKRLAYLQKKESLTDQEKKELKSLPPKIQKSEQNLAKAQKNQKPSNKVIELTNELKSLPEVDDKKPLFHTLKAIDNLSMFLSLKDATILESSLDVLDDKTLISDDNVVTRVFETVFGFEISTENIGKLSRPDVFIGYHSRLTELSGREREQALEAYQRFILAVVNGNLDAVRHQKEDNPHLSAVYQTDPTVKEPWSKELRKPIEELVESSFKKYEGFEVFDTFDPCDLLKQGSDIGNSCLDLNGRLYKIKGLLGYILDGKTHTIVVKDKNGRILAHTRLQLLIDTTKNKPVLYQDQCNLITTSDDDDTLETALQEMCKYRARELGLSLVSDRVQTETYNGKVMSLGSCVPFDYVNSFHKTTNGIYSLVNMHLITIS